MGPLRVTAAGPSPNHTEFPFQLPFEHLNSINNGMAVTKFGTNVNSFGLPCPGFQCYIILKKYE